MTSIVLRILAWVLIAGAAAGWHGLDCGLETSRVGQRVLTEVSVTGPGAPPPVSGEPDQTAVDPATWRVVSLRMPNDSQPGTHYQMELLQPAGWIARNGAAVGRWVDLSLPELQISGMAQVLGIEPCPPIESGYGRVVLGTFTSVSSDVYELKLAGQDEAIGVTYGHPIWSLERGDWIAAGALRPGERPATAAGEAVVESVAVEPGVRRVYNLSVEGDARYLVGELGVVVHNTCPSGRSLADVVADDAVFLRWLKRSHPVDQPLSQANARLVWDKLVAMQMNPVLHPSGQTGRYCRGPHINVIVGTRRIHIPVDPGFVS